MKLQRPILVGGLGLSFSLWILNSFQDSLVQVGEFGLISLLAVGGSLWLLKQNRPKNSSEIQDSMTVDRAAVEVAIAASQAVVNQIAQETTLNLDKLGQNLLHVFQQSQNSFNNL